MQHKKLIFGTIIFTIIRISVLHAQSEVPFKNFEDFFNLPFGSHRSTIQNISNERSYVREDIVYYRYPCIFIGTLMIEDLFFGFKNDTLVGVEAITHTEKPVNSYCYDTEFSKVIRKKMHSIDRELRICQINGYTSSPEEFRRNYSYYKECVDRFTNYEDVTCDIDVFEEWKENAKETDKALITVFQLVSIGYRPVNKCKVRLIFRPGRRLSEKLKEEKEKQEGLEELFKIMEEAQ